MLMLEFERQLGEEVAAARRRVLDDSLASAWRWKFRLVFPVIALAIVHLRNSLLDSPADTERRILGFGVAVGLLLAYWIPSVGRAVNRWQQILIGHLGPWPRPERWTMNEDGLEVESPFAKFFRPWSMLTDVRMEQHGLTLRWTLGMPLELPARLVTPELKRTLDHFRAASAD